jgi:hypothetical protein
MNQKKRRKKKLDEEKKSRESIVQHRHCLKHLTAKKGGEEKRGQPWRPTTRHYQTRPQHYYHQSQLGQPCTDHILV